MWVSDVTALQIIKNLCNPHNPDIINMYNIIYKSNIKILLIIININDIYNYYKLKKKK